MNHRKGDRAGEAASVGGTAGSIRGGRRSPDDDAAVKVFLSYAHEDAEHRENLAKHLAVMERSGQVQTWHDRQILAGADWADEIDRNLEQADVILLLVSADFLASDYCYGREMKRALERHHERSARVIPVIVRPVNWQGAPFGFLQALPEDGKPVTTWDNTDEAWASVGSSIQCVVRQIDERRRFEQAVVRSGGLSAPRARLVGGERRRICLRVEHGLLANHVFYPDAGVKLLIGRSEDAQIRLHPEDRRASRTHAWIEVGEDMAVLHDIKSKNGTFVNDRLVRDRRLQHGDLIRCGQTRVRVETTIDPERTLTEVRA